jgi:hypothetical protein
MNEGALAFREFLLGQFPDWNRHMRAHVGSGPADAFPPGGLIVEVPSPRDNGPVLRIFASDREALVALGDRGGEQLFTWDDATQRVDALQSVLTLINDILTGEVVVVRRRYRAFWKSWETAQFARAADVVDERQVSRTDAWPSS